MTNVNRTRTRTGGFLARTRTRTRTRMMFGYGFGESFFLCFFFLKGGVGGFSFFFISFFVHNFRPAIRRPSTFDFNFD